jgi:hypothetical protein
MGPNPGLAMVESAYAALRRDKSGDFYRIERKEGDL